MKELEATQAIRNAVYELPTSAGCSVFLSGRRLRQAPVPELAASSPEPRFNRRMRFPNGMTVPVRLFATERFTVCIRRDLPVNRKAK